MDRKNFEETAKRLKKAFETGVTYLKAGAQEAGFVKDKAMEAVKLEMDLIKIRNKLEKEYQALGKGLSPKLLRGTTFKITAFIKEKAKHIASLEKEEAHLEKTLEHFTVIRKQKG